MIKVVVVDENPVFRRGLQKMWSESRICLVGEAATGAAGMACLREKRPEVVLLDSHLPDMTGVAFCRSLSRHFPKISPLFLINRPHLPTLSRLLETTAKGFLTKNASYFSQEAIETLAAGGTYLQPDLALTLLHYRWNQAPHPLDQLNDHEYETLVMTARGKTYAEIAEVLHVSIRTIYNLKSVGYKKLGVQTSQQLCDMILV